MCLLHEWRCCFAVTVFEQRNFFCSAKGSHSNDNLTLNKDVLCVLGIFFFW